MKHETNNPIGEIDLHVWSAENQKGINIYLYSFKANTLLVLKSYILHHKGCIKNPPVLIPIKFISAVWPI